MRTILFCLLAIFIGNSALAESFAPITERDRFLKLVQNRNLTRVGITLSVRPDGKIEGRAFGRQVTGAWQWRGGYFCRDLYWGSRDLGPNCQAVKLQGNTIRFISDQGAGQFADLHLR